MKSISHRDYSCTQAGAASLSFAWWSDANARAATENDDAMRMLYTGRAQAAYEMLRLLVCPSGRCTAEDLLLAYPELRGVLAATL